MTSNESAQQPFVLKHTFNAPCDLVFKAWTEPDRLAHWWGPKGFAVRVCKLDLKPGGVFLYGMRSPDGLDLWGKWVFREIVVPERLVFLASFTDEQGNAIRHPFAPNWPLETLSTVTFTEQDGKTTLTLEGLPYNATEPERKVFTDAHGSMHQGWGGTLQQLTEYLATA